LLPPLLLLSLLLLWSLPPLLLLLLLPTLCVLLLNAVAVAAALWHARWEWRSRSPCGRACGLCQLPTAAVPPRAAGG
jgi:hypothetical protein